MSFDVPLQRPPCARCRRLRLLAVSIVAGVLLCAALVLMAHAAVPAASAPPAASLPLAPAAASAVHAASAAASAAAAPAPVGAASAAQDLRFIYQTVVLPQGRQGADYGPRAIVRGGVAPYTFVVEGKFPPGLELTPQGMLGGLPTAAGSYSFVLKARDASNPPMLTQQPYVLRVVAPPALSASSPPPPLKAITRDEAAAVPDPNRGQPISYKLTADGIARLVALVAPEEAPTPAPAEADPTAAAAPASAPEPMPAGPPLAAQPLPSADQLSALLQPLQDVEYPTQALFESALRTAHCTYYQSQVKALALGKGVTVDLQCPPPAPPATAASRPRPRNAQAPGALPLYQFYAELLPAELHARVVAEAAQVHLLAEAKSAVWTGGGCGCVLPRHPEELIHGFYPFWHAGDKAQTVDFSLLDRVSYMGLVLNDAGAYDPPAGWADGRTRFVREARRHGTAVDLVLYRRDWTTLLQLPPAKLSQFTRLAASNAVAAADVPLQDAWSRFGPVLRPFWNEPAQAYDGITLFFEDSPTDPEGRKRFRQFFRAFMLQLIEEMQRSGRPYFLNVAVPDAEMGEDGAYPFRDLLDYIERAMPRRRAGTTAGATVNAEVEASARSAVRYQGTTDITVKYLILLSSPSDERKKELRTLIDHADAQGLEGHRRIAFFESVAPVLFYRLPEKPAPLPPAEADQLDRDLAYIKWTYNDVAFWPLPVLGTGSGDDARNRLSHNFGAPPRPVDGLCRWVCPNRTPLHLLLEALVLTSAGLAAVYLWNCRVRRLGRTYLLFLWGSVLATLLLAFAFLSCDPDLAALRESNSLLYVLILVLCGAGLYATFRRRVEAP